MPGCGLEPILREHEFIPSEADPTVCGVTMQLFRQVGGCAYPEFSESDVPICGLLASHDVHMPANRSMEGDC